MEAIKQHIFLKILALIIVVTMISYDIVWAYPPNQDFYFNNKLQAQSIFKPMSDVGIEVDEMMKSEILFAVRLALRGKSRTSINRTLNRWLWRINNREKEKSLRLIELLDARKNETGNASVIFCVRDNYDHLFQITYFDQSGISNTNRYDKLSNTAIDLTDQVVINRIKRSSYQIPAASVLNVSTCILGYDPTKSTPGIEPMPMEDSMMPDEYIGDVLDELESTHPDEYKALEGLTGLDIRFCDFMDKGGQLLSWPQEEGNDVIIGIDETLKNLPKGPRDILFYLFLVYLGTMTKLKGKDYLEADITDKTLALLEMARLYVAIDDEVRKEFIAALKTHLKEGSKSYLDTLKVIESKKDVLSAEEISNQEIKRLAEKLYGRGKAKNLDITGIKEILKSRKSMERLDLTPKTDTTRAVKREDELEIRVTIPELNEENLKEALIEAAKEIQKLNDRLSMSYKIRESKSGNLRNAINMLKRGNSTDIVFKYTWADQYTYDYSDTYITCGARIIEEGKIEVVFKDYSDTGYTANGTSAGVTYTSSKAPDERIPRHRVIIKISKKKTKKFHSTSPSLLNIHQITDVARNMTTSKIYLSAAVLGGAALADIVVSRRRAIRQKKAPSSDLIEALRLYYKSKTELLDFWEAGTS